MVSNNTIQYIPNNTVLLSDIMSEKDLPIKIK